MKEKEIKAEEQELENVSEAQETEQQEQQAEAPAQEQKQEVKDEKPEKAKKEHPVLDKVGAFGKKVGRGVKKAAPIAVAVIAGLGVGKLLGKVEAYNEVLGDSGNNDIPELPGDTEQPAPEIEDAEFHEISTDEQSVE